MAAGKHVGVRSHSLSCTVDGIWPGGRRAGHGRESAGTRDGERVWKAVPVPRLRVHRIRRTRRRGIDHRGLSNVVPRVYHSGAHDPAGSNAGLLGLAAAIAVGLGAIGTAWAQSRIGAAAAGAIAERPEMGGLMLVFLALPETMVILGFLVAFFVIGKI